MTDEEWQRLYPEDWLPAEKEKEYNPDYYDFIWDEDYSHFRLNKLAYSDVPGAYIRYQAME